MPGWAYRVCRRLEAARLCSFSRAVRAWERKEAGDSEDWDAYVGLLMEFEEEEENGDV